MLGNHKGSFVGFEYDATTIMAQAANNGLSTVPLRVVLHVPPNFGDFSVSSVYNGSKQFPLQMCQLRQYICDICMQNSYVSISVHVTYNYVVRGRYGTEKCAENRLFTMWKGQMNRWDFAPPFWQLGLWRNVSLVIREPAPVAFANQALVVRTKSIQWGDGGYRYGGLELGSSSLATSALLNISATLQATGVGGSSGSVDLSIEWEVSCATDSSAPTAKVRTNHTVELIGRRQTVTAEALVAAPYNRYLQTQFLECSQSGWIFVCKKTKLCTYKYSIHIMGSR